MLKKILIWIYTKFIVCIVTYTPTILGDVLRKIYIKLLSKECGEKFVAHIGVQFFYPWNLKIGKNVSISRFTIINSNKEIEIGDNVMIGPNCNIMTANHGFRDITVPMNMQHSPANKLVIKDDVWIGNGVVINSGSREIEISKGIVIASNSVVNKSLDKEYGIYGGVPAKFIKFRNDD